MAELIEQTIEIGGRLYGLPHPRTPLVGRDHELAGLLARIADPAAPLVTITGPGGVGKTRLAVQAARESRDLFGGEIVFVSLADVTNLEWFVRRVSQSLRLPGLETSFSESGLIDALADRTVLLVLDNLEQIPDAGSLLARMLAACPAVKMLVTSRVAMHLRGEFEFPLAPLGLPSFETHRPTAFEELAANSAVILFVERAQAVDPGFALTEENAADIAQICARLDGLPLAIELAAARLKLLTPAALLSRLDSRLRILAGGARDLPNRQQNLRQTIAWSYDLLESPARAAFRAVAVFSGAFNLAAAAEVLGVDEDDAELLDTIGALIDQSLLRRTGATGDEPRLSMLETIREFGIEQLKASGEELAVRSAHAGFFRRLVERSADQASGLWLLSSTDELEDEMPNIHQALDWYIEREEVDGAVSIVLAMSNFWIKRGYLVEGSRLMERAIEFVDRIEPETRVRMLRYSAWFICVGGNADEALMRAARAVEMARSIDRPNELAGALSTLGIIHYLRQEFELARAAWEEVLAIEPPVAAQRVGALNNLGVLARLARDYESSRDFLERSLEERARRGEPDPDAATELNLAEVSIELGDSERGRTLLTDWFAEPRRMRSPELAAGSVWGVARLATVDGDFERAGRLLGWADERRKRVVPHDTHEEIADTKMRSTLTAALGAERFARLLEEGAELTNEILLAMIKEQLHARRAQTGLSPRSGVPAPARLDPLTAREIEVARLVAAGKSTRDIADSLFISTRTAQTHVTNILGKLDLESRAALAAWMVRNDPENA